MVNFQNLVSNLNIPVLRKAVHTAWLNIIVAPLDLVQMWWQERLTGQVHTLFNSATNYNANDYVRYGRATYFCILTPAISLFPLPTNLTYWYKISDDYIGLKERSKYSAQKVMLEFALNRRFSPTTITPPFSASNVSIYITNNANNPTVLYSARGNVYTSTWTAPKSSTSFWYSILGNPNITTFYNFTIHVPTAIMTAINPTLAEAIFVISQEVDKYKLAGTTYNIVQY